MREVGLTGWNYMSVHREAKRQNLFTGRVTEEQATQADSLFCAEKVPSETPWGVTLSSFINSHNQWITPLHTRVSPDWLS